MMIKARIGIVKNAKLNGKINKFVSDNTLLNQVWIMDTKMKVNQVIKQHSAGEEIKVLDFVRFKVGEGID